MHKYLYSYSCSAMVVPLLTLCPVALVATITLCGNEGLGIACCRAPPLLPQAACRSGHDLANALLTTVKTHYYQASSRPAEQTGAFLLFDHLVQLFDVSGDSFWPSASQATWRAVIPAVHCRRNTTLSRKVLYGRTMCLLLRLSASSSTCLH